MSNGQNFSLIGELNDGLKISVESCVMYSISEYSVSHNLGTYVARFSAYYTKVFDEDRLKDLDSKRGDLHFEVGILNFYSRYELSIQTELCVIKTKNLLSEEEIAIVKNSFIPHISTVFTTKINNDEQTWKDIIEELMATISKVLELSSFALATEHTWSYLKIYSDDPSTSSPQHQPHMKRSIPLAYKIS